MCAQGNERPLRALPQPAEAGEDRCRTGGADGRPHAGGGVAELADDLLLSLRAVDRARCRAVAGVEPEAVAAELAARLESASREAVSLAPSALRRYLRLRCVVRHPETVGAAWIGRPGRRLLATETLFHGPLDLCPLDPEPILARGRSHGARELLLFWTNGGDSLGELAHLWNRLVELERACAEARLPLLDGLMLSSRGWYSWRQNRGTEAPPTASTGVRR